MRPAPLLAAACAALALAAPASAKIKVETFTSPLAGGRPVEAVAGQALVKFDPSASAAAKTAALAAAGASVAAEMPSVGWTIVNLPGGMSVPAGLALLRGLPGVQAVDWHHVYHPSLLPNDLDVSQQWNLSNVNAFAAWDFETGFTNPVTVFMIDSGIDGTHPELAPKLTGTSQFFDPDNPIGVGGTQSVNNPPTPACNHATRTSGIVAAQTNNGAGIAGLSWGAKLVSLKIFNDADCGGNPAGDCVGACNTQDQSIINAITYAKNQQGQPGIGLAVINLSIGGQGPCSPAVQTALNTAAAAGIPIAISAGNDGGAVNNPANCATTGPALTGIIPVGAVDQGNNVASFSSNGPELAAEGVVAPGVFVVTTDVGGKVTGGATGTSFSAPHVAGLLALLRSAKNTNNNIAGARQLQAWVRGGADNIGVSSLATGSAIGPSGNSAGAGRMNAFRSMRLAVRGTLADFAGDQKAIAFPNPLRVSQNETATITIPTSLQGSAADIKIYTPTGQLVRDLSSSLVWDGRNDAGQLVASGTYIFTVKTAAGKTTGRLAVIR